MFNSVALDVVIGLVFIYLLYSLLATVLSEIIATNFGLRARNLKVAVSRMLTDEDDKDYFWLWKIVVVFKDTIWDGLKSLVGKGDKNPVVEDFYNHPEIKYLGKGGIFSTPSAFKAISFSKTLLQVITKDQPPTSELISSQLEEMVRLAKAHQENILLLEGDQAHQENEAPEQPAKYFDLDTAQYLLNMWKEAGADIDKFKLQLETWFDRTMEQATEWYKRKIQIVLLVIGLGIATFFNADSFVIISKLSNDKEARKQMVEMASAYIKSNPPPLKNDGTPNYDQKSLDSLNAVRKELQKDIDNANTILGTGSSLPDSIPFVLLMDSVVFANWKDTTTILQTAVQYEKMPDQAMDCGFSFQGDSMEISRKDSSKFYALNFDTANFRGYMLKHQYYDTVSHINEKGKKVIDSIKGPFTDTSKCLRSYIGLMGLQKLEGLDSNTVESLVPFLTQSNHNVALLGYYHFSWWDKVCYLWALFYKHFWGYLLTAIAVSLGAPFWFDMLNKLMRLRSSQKQDPDTPNTTAAVNQSQTPITVSVNTSTNGSQEAVG